MDKAELIEKTKLELSRIISLARREGLNSWQILTLLPEIMNVLILQAEAEYWLNQKKN